MQKFKFGNPLTFVEVSKSPLDRPEPGNRSTKSIIMKQIWNDIKERWPLAVLGALFGLAIIMMI